MRRFWHLVLRIGLWLIGIFFLVIFAAILYIRIQYPEPKILDMLSKTVHSSTGMPLTIQDISWKLPLKLHIEEIVLGYPESNLETDTPFVALDRFSISFRLVALLRRQLHVQSVTIGQPKIYIHPDKLKSLEFEKLGAAEETTDDAPIDPAKSRLPVSIQLSRLQLQDFESRMILSEKGKNTQIEISGLNLELSHMQIPRDVTSSLEAVRGQIYLYTRDSEINYFSNDDIINKRKITMLERNN